MPARSACSALEKLLGEIFAGALGVDPSNASPDPPAKARRQTVKTPNDTAPKRGPHASAAPPSAHATTRIDPDPPSARAASPGLRRPRPILTFVNKSKTKLRVVYGAIAACFARNPVRRAMCCGCCLKATFLTA